MFSKSPKGHCELTIDSSCAHGISGGVGQTACLAQDVRYSTMFAERLQCNDQRQAEIYLGLDLGRRGGQV